VSDCGSHSSPEEGYASLPARSPEPPRLFLVRRILLPRAGRLSGGNLTPHPRRFAPPPPLARGITSFPARRAAPGNFGSLWISLAPLLVDAAPRFRDRNHPRGGANSSSSAEVEVAAALVRAFDPGSPRSATANRFRARPRVLNSASIGDMAPSASGSGPGAPLCPCWSPPPRDPCSRF